MKLASKKLRVAAAIIVLAITIGAFTYYIVKHPSTITQLRHMNPLVLVVLLALYLVFTVALAIITAYSLEVGRAKIPFRENILLTCYSSIVNFFGPLQSGPGFRILYLKKRHNISVKDYTFATLLYYGFFALFSGLFLCVNVLKWWQTVLVGLLIIVISVAVLRRKKGANMAHYSIEAIVKLALASLAQVFVVAVIYFIELHTVNAHITFAQAVTYTGAANFALFVSLTPGAIGFRESFLLLSQRLHHIDSANVLAASVIDRAVYLVFLGVLFVLSLAFHVQDRLKIKKVERSAASKP